MMLLGVSLGIRPAGNVSSPAVVEPSPDGIKLFSGINWETFAGENIEEFE